MTGLLGWRKDAIPAYSTFQLAVTVWVPQYSLQLDVGKGFYFFIFLDIDFHQLGNLFRKCEKYLKR